MKGFHEVLKLNFYDISSFMALESFWTQTPQLLKCIIVSYQAQQVVWNS